MGWVTFYGSVTCKFLFEPFLFRIRNRLFIKHYYKYIFLLYTEPKMLNKNIAIAFAVVVAIVCMAEATEEGPQNMAEALRMLQELDRIYTQAARPR